MPSFKLDGREVPIEPGDTIMRAAWRQGIEIPHYCFHPGLSVAANCRMCLVEIKSDRPMMMPTLKWDAEKQAYVPAQKPKLTPACQAPAVENQEVFSKSPEALNAQGHVQEFLLLNHPVDCPICDQAGECKLQDYWYTSQGKTKRKKTEPVHKPKAVRFGPTIVYDAERCIMCTRCIRFCDEIVHDHVLDMRERGNKNEITVSVGRQLDHKYTLMTEHVCPVGALTSRDFRFKARVWFLRTAKGVCNGCATGCNSYVDFDPRHNKVYRLRPRDNAAVNKYWMCDDGMLSYHAIHEGRVTQPRIQNGDTRGTSSAEALKLASSSLAKANAAKIGIVLSAQFSCEDNLVLAQFARVVLNQQTNQSAPKFYLAAKNGWDGDNILRDNDNNPNRAGALAAAGGAQVGSLSDLLADVKSGAVEGFIALGGAVDETSQTLAPLRALTTGITLASNAGALEEVAHVVIPVTCFAEMDGTFVNAKGMAQRFSRAIHPAPGVAPAWQMLIELAKLMSRPLALRDLTEVRKALPPGATATPAGAGAAKEASR